MRSIKAEEIDSAEVGVLMRNYSESEGTYTSEFGSVSLDVPYAYEENIQGNQATYANVNSGILISAVPNKSISNISGLKTMLKEMENTNKETYSADAILSTKEATVNGNKCVKNVLKIDDGEETVYMECCGVIKNKTAYVFIAVYPELSYSENARNEVAQIIFSLR